MTNTQEKGCHSLWPGGEDWIAVVCTIFLDNNWTLNGVEGWKRNSEISESEDGAAAASSLAANMLTPLLIRHHMTLQLVYWLREACNTHCTYILLFHRGEKPYTQGGCKAHQVPEERAHLVWGDFDWQVNVMQLIFCLCNTCEVVKENFMIVQNGHWLDKPAFLTLVPPSVRLLDSQIFAKFSLSRPYLCNHKLQSAR